MLTTNLLIARALRLDLAFSFNDDFLGGQEFEVKGEHATLWVYALHTGEVDLCTVKRGDVAEVLDPRDVHEVMIEIARREVTEVIVPA